jgi:hypothetical protein
VCACLPRRYRLSCCTRFQPYRPTNRRWAGVAAKMTDNNVI